MAGQNAHDEGIAPLDYPAFETNDVSTNTLYYIHRADKAKPILRQVETWGVAIIRAGSSSGKSSFIHSIELEANKSGIYGDRIYSVMAPEPAKVRDTAQTVANFIEEKLEGGMNASAFLASCHGSYEHEQESSLFIIDEA